VDRERGSHTYWNIRETGCYTINHVPATHTVQAHQVSARYPEETSEFDAVGFTPIFQCGFDAPAVEESPVRIGLERVGEWEIPQNRCRFIVGQIRWMEFPEEAWAADGYLDIESLGVAALSSLDGYHRTEKVHRLAYAKPGIYPPEALEDFKAGWKDD
jgi:flavin reductase (DIM6/NTAB) family NADH-FMN oxidoreductase RutF